MIDPKMADLYLRFVEERHHVWRRRQLDPDAAPWTGDNILATKKFTNVFRVLDHGSQFVVRELLYSDSPSQEDALVRAFAYRYTNRPEPFIAFKEDMGRYPVRADLESVLPQVWRDYHAQGNPLFGNAYKMFVGQENRGWTRSEWVMRHINDAMGYGPDNVVEDFLQARSAAAKHAVLVTVPRCANFMGLQVLTDWGYYDPEYSENEFVVAGPGSTLGAKEIDPDAKPYDMIMWAHHEVLERPYVPRLGSHLPSWMDIQNTLCEFSKYVRYWRQPPKASRYRPAHPGIQPQPFLPPQWRAGL